MKTKFAGLLLVFPALLMVAPHAFSSVRGRDIDEHMAKDPVCKKWLYYGDEMGKAKGRYDPDGKIWAMRSDCGLGATRCKLGWDAFLGKPDETWGEFWADSLAHTEDQEWGENPPIWKLNTDNRVGERAVLSLPLWTVKDADAIVAKTINTPLKHETLWCGDKRDTHEQKYLPYRALWFLGAKNQADVMIKGLAIPSKLNYTKCNQTHRDFFFSVAHEWKLSADQNKAIVELCSTMFQSDDTRDQDTRQGCVRYLSAVKTTDKDTIEYIKNFLSETGELKTEAIRAVGRLGIKDKGVITKLIAPIKDNENEKTVNKKKVIYYKENHNIGEAMVALYALGDSNGEKVIKTWLLWNKADKELDNEGGFEVLMREAPFVAESHRKKLADLIKKTYPEVVKIAATKNQYKRFARKAAAALLQLGDKAGLEHALEIIKEGDKDEIQELFRFLGADGFKYGTGAFGTGGVKVGKDGLSEKDALSIVEAIRARFKFWNDTDQKEMGIWVSLDIASRIKASK